MAVDNQAPYSQLDCTLQPSCLVSLVKAKGNQAPGSWLAPGNAAGFPTSSGLRAVRLQVAGLRLATQQPCQLLGLV